jgi:hypothetical protein
MVDQTPGMDEPAVIVLARDGSVKVSRYGSQLRGTTPSAVTKENAIALTVPLFDMAETTVDEFKKLAAQQKVATERPTSPQASTPRISDTTTDAMGALFSRLAALDTRCDTTLRRTDATPVESGGAGTPPRIWRVEIKLRHPEAKVQTESAELADALQTAIRMAEANAWHKPE